MFYVINLCRLSDSEINDIIFYLLDFSKKKMPGCLSLYVYWLSFALLFRKLYCEIFWTFDTGL